MTERSFVDTNIFVYARDKKNSTKRRRSLDLLSSLKRENNLIISSQVVTEFCAVLTKKFLIAEDLINKDVKRLLALDPLPIDRNLIEAGLLIRQQYNLSWWDSWIVGAAIVADCKTIYSEDLAGGASYHGIQVVNPYIVT